MFRSKATACARSATPNPRAAVVGTSRTPFRPDCLLDGWREPDISLLAASVRGHGHRIRGLPRQDDMSIVFDDTLRRVVVAVADGVSSAESSHVGAATAVRYATQWIDTQCRSLPVDEIPWLDLVEHTAWAVKESADRLLGHEVEHVTAAECVATTLSVVVLEATAEGTSLLGSGIAVGDSSMGVIGADGLTTLTDGKPDDEGGVTSSAVHPLPYVIRDRLQPVTFTVDPGQTFLIGTDGIWDALGSGDGPIGASLRAAVGAPFTSPIEFGRAVDFVKESFDDDRTLVAVWPVVGK